MLMGFICGLVSSLQIKLGGDWRVVVLIAFILKWSLQLLVYRFNVLNPPFKPLH